jgi:hypothetical protein
MRTGLDRRQQRQVGEFGRNDAEMGVLRGRGEQLRTKGIRTILRIRNGAEPDAPVTR